MVQHMDIQKPDNYSDKDYKAFRFKLGSQYTSKKELEEICMTLAHLPTKEASEILDEFKKTERGGDVEWLDCAIEENKFLLLSPENEQERRDFIAIKLIGEIFDKIVELQCQTDGYQLCIIKNEIRLQALGKLQSENQIDHEIAALNEVMKCNKQKINDIQQSILLEEKIEDEIRASIVSEKYKKLDPMDLVDFHHDGE
ncbi:hypothetical protein KAR48_13580 [bacterium]|nr:hypothetical protein [bacterium]